MPQQQNPRRHAPRPAVVSDPPFFLRALCTGVFRNGYKAGVAIRTLSTEQLRTARLKAFEPKTCEATPGSPMGSSLGLASTAGTARDGVTSGGWYTAFNPASSNTSTVADMDASHQDFQSAYSSVSPPPLSALPMPALSNQAYEYNTEDTDDDECFRLALALSLRDR